MAPQIHIEVVQLLRSKASKQSIIDAVKNIDEITKVNLIIPGTTVRHFSDSFLKSNVDVVHVCEINEDESKSTVKGEVEYKFYVYRLDEDGQQAEVMEGESGEGDDLTVASHWILPSLDFHGLWDSLVYDHSLKDSLLNFVQTTLLFSDKNVDSNLITWNRVVLLHGPPGTGKTSLCKALAQKLSIRLSNRYSHGELIEINSHSLFSKWCSESGKLVMKMFSKIEEMIEDPRALVCVLIDEVESLAHARHSSLQGSEPSDSIRVVNAMLTQIDRIKRYPNVLILTTSNITRGIDLAFVDRADIKQYVGLPSVSAIYSVYQSCIKELQRTEIIHSKESVMNLKLLELSSFEPNVSTNTSIKLYEVAKLSEGFSGRTLRKLPFLAHAYFLQQPSVSLENFIDALHKAVIKQKMDCDDFHRS